MPFESKKQEAWAHTPEGTEALGGKAAVEEWDKETEGKKLPERKAPAPRSTPPKKYHQPFRMRHTASPR